MTLPWENNSLHYITTFLTNTKTTQDKTIRFWFVDGSEPKCCENMVSLVFVESNLAHEQGQFKNLTGFPRSWKSHGKWLVMEKSWKSHGKLLVMEKSWNSVGHGKSHGKPKFGQIYFVDFVELRALKEFLNFAINIFITFLSFCKSRTYFEIVTMAKVCPGRVWWLLQHFSYISHFKRVK